MTLRSALFVAASAALTLSTGCGFVAGQLAGGLWTGQGIATPNDFDSFLGTSVVCLGTTAELSSLERAAGLFQVEGEVLDTDFSSVEADFDNVVPCWTEPSTALRVLDEDGEVWTVGFGWLAGDGYDITPWPSVGVEQPVALRVRADRAAGSQAAGMVLSQGGRLVYALESGRGGQGLQSGDIPGLEFQTLGAVGTYSTDCGERATLSQQFTVNGRDTVMFAGEDTGLQVGNESMTTCSIDAWELVDGGCEDEDITTESSWVMFR